MCIALAGSFVFGVRVIFDFQKLGGRKDRIVWLLLQVMIVEDVRVIVCDFPVYYTLDGNF